MSTGEVPSKVQQEVAKKPARSPLSQHDQYWRERRAREYARYLSGSASRGDLKHAFDNLADEIRNIEIAVELLGRYMVSKGLGTFEEYKEFVDLEMARIREAGAVMEGAAQAAAQQSGSPLPVGAEGDTIEFGGTPHARLPGGQSAVDEASNEVSVSSASAQAENHETPAD